jgi:hypothetical protein
MTFWRDSKLQPKRAYKFLLSVAGANNVIREFLIERVKKPSWTISKSEHQFLNHTFHYPGKTTWTPVDFTIVDVVDPNANGSQAVMKLLEESGYKTPQDENTLETVSKQKSVGALGTVTIHTLDSDENIIEDWVLVNAWIENVDFGEFDYKSEEMMKVTVTLAYDFAYLNVFNGAGKLPSNATGAN